MSLLPNSPPKKVFPVEIIVNLTQYVLYIFTSMIGIRQMGYDISRLVSSGSVIDPGESVRVMLATNDWTYHYRV